MANLASLNKILPYVNNLKSGDALESMLHSQSLNSKQFQTVQAIKMNNFSQNNQLKKDAYALKVSSQEMIKNNNNAKINAKTVKSDNAAITGIASNGAKRENYTLEVSKIAKAQINKGKDIVSSDNSLFSKGENAFKITSSGKETKVSFKVEDGDTNEGVLKKMATAINDSKSGIFAKVVTDDTKKTSRLEITGDKTGEKNTFEIADVEGNAVSTSGTTEKTTSAQNAEYKLDGKEEKSETNEISIDDGNVKIKFNDVTKEQSKVSIKDDSKAIYNSIDNFAISFNNFIESFKSSSVSSEKLAKDISKITSTERGELSGIGISVKQDGSLSIDKERLTKAIEEDSNKVKSIVGGYNEMSAKAIKVADKELSGVYDSTGAAISKTEFSTYISNGSKSLNIQNNVRGLFVNSLL